jgi:hypothetical protein
MPIFPSRQLALVKFINRLNRGLIDKLYEILIKYFLRHEFN